MHERAAPEISVFQFGGAMFSQGVTKLKRVTCFNNIAIVVCARGRVTIGILVLSDMPSAASLAHKGGCIFHSAGHLAIMDSNMTSNSGTLVWAHALLPNSRPARLSFLSPLQGAALASASGRLVISGSLLSSNVANLVRVLPGCHFSV